MPRGISADRHELIEAIKAEVAKNIIEAESCRAQRRRLIGQSRWWFTAAQRDLLARCYSAADFKRVLRIPEPGAPLFDDEPFASSPDPEALHRLSHTALWQMLTALERLELTNLLRRALDRRGIWWINSRISEMALLRDIDPQRWGDLWVTGDIPPLVFLCRNRLGLWRKMTETSVEKAAAWRCRGSA